MLLLLLRLLPQHLPCCLQDNSHSSMCQVGICQVPEHAMSATLLVQTACLNSEQLQEASSWSVLLCKVLLLLWCVPLQKGSVSGQLLFN
jgi:hypothetical protein